MGSYSSRTSTQTLDSAQTHVQACKSTVRAPRVRGALGGTLREGSTKDWRQSHSQSPFFLLLSSFPYAVDSLCRRSLACRARRRPCCHLEWIKGQRNCTRGPRASGQVPRTIPSNDHCSNERPMTTTNNYRPRLWTCARRQQLRLLSADSSNASPWRISSPDST